LETELKNLNLSRITAYNFTVTQAGFSYFVGQERGNFKVQFFVGS
jgi:hypothetical protein